MTESALTQSPQNITFQGFTKDATIALVVKISSLFITYLLQVLLARWMGKIEYGIYEYVMAWTLFLTIPAGLGLPRTTVRLIAEYKVNQDFGSLHGVFKGSWLLILLGSLTVSLVVLGIVLFINHDHEFVYAIPLLVGIWILPLQALVTLYKGVATALEQIALAYIPSDIIYPTLVLGAGFIIWQNHHSLNSLPLIILAGVILFVVTTVQFLLVRRKFNHEFIPTTPVYTYREWLKLSLTLLIQQSFFVILDQSDILMVGSLIGPESAGIYNAAIKTAEWTGLALLTLNMVASPRFATLYAQKDISGLQKLVSEANMWIFIPTTLISVCLLLFTEPILSIFGADFISANWTLKVLVIGRLVDALCGSVGSLMVMTGHQNKSLPVFGWCALMNIALNAIAIPHLGMTGAAIATSITMITWNIWLSVLVIKYVKVNPAIFSFLFKPDSKSATDT
ncbi:MAG: flippase [Dolichospermum sp.]